MLYPESTWARFEQEFPIPEKYRKYYEYKNWHIEPKSSDLSQFEQDHPFAFMLMPEDMQNDLYLWTKGLAKRKTINSDYTSYGIKHLFTDLPGGFYITNGMMKGALLAAGFEIADYAELNWRANISGRSIKEQIKLAPHIS